MTDEDYMRLALRLARRGAGCTSPNPMVGAVLVKDGRIIGQGWHLRAGEPHAEIEALQDAERKGNSPFGATLYVTLEPCCTHGRTPPCTEAILSSGIRKVVAGATDPNPRHCGKGFALLRRRGLRVITGVLQAECERLNAVFNHWIRHGTPLVTVKAAMTLDGKIATSSGQSRWITGEPARLYGMSLRAGQDAILVGINTVLADDPRLTLRSPSLSAGTTRKHLGRSQKAAARPLRRIILDSDARTPVTARVVSDGHPALTTIVAGKQAPKERVARLAKRVQVLVGPANDGEIDLIWLLKTLGRQEITSLLVEGGGQVNASFLLGGLAQRIAFFYAPKILGGRDARKAVAGPGAAGLGHALGLHNVHWRKVGEDWLLTADCRKNARR